MTFCSRHASEPFLSKAPREPGVGNMPLGREDPLGHLLRRDFLGLASHQRVDGSISHDCVGEPIDCIWHLIVVHPLAPFLENQHPAIPGAPGISPVNHSQCIDTHFSVLEDERHRLLDAAVERSHGASRALPRGLHPVRPREEEAREVIPGATGSEGPNVQSVCLVGVRRERIKRLPELPALLATIDPASIPEAPVDAVSDLADALEATLRSSPPGS